MQHPKQSWRSTGEAGKEDPQMCALAASGPLHGTGDLPFCADAPNGGDILLPCAVIKVDGEKTAGIVRQNGVQANHIPAIRILTAEMVVDHLIVQRNQIPMLAFGARPLGLDADT